MFDNMAIEKVENQELSTISRSNSAVARVQAKFVMALQRPRNTEAARVRILDACKRPRFAEKAMYKLPIGRSYIQGRTIRFAEEVIRLWGNIDVKSTVINEDETYRDISVSVLDLETNTSYEHEIRIKKTKEKKKLLEGEIPTAQRTNTKGEVVFILSVTEADLFKKQNSEISKSIRNSGLRLVPPDILEEADDMIKATMSGHIKANIKDERRKILDAFNELGIDPSELEEYLEQKVTTLDAKAIEELRLIYTGIKDRMTTWKEVLDTKRRAKEEERRRREDIEREPINLNNIQEIPPEPEESPKANTTRTATKDKEPSHDDDNLEESFEAQFNNEPEPKQQQEWFAQPQNPVDLLELAPGYIESLTLAELKYYVMKGIWEAEPTRKEQDKRVKASFGVQNLVDYTDIDKLQKYLRFHLPALVKVARKAKEKK